MIAKFLNAKHWQLFALMIGVPIVFEIFMISFMFSEATNGNRPPFNFMVFFPLIMITFMGAFFGWFWSIAIGLQAKVPKQVKMKVRKFKILFFIPLVYILLFSLIISGLFNGLFSGPGRFPGEIMAFILPLHLFSMFCIFYCLYFVSKTIKTVELQRDVAFGDFAAEFFLLWFYIVGIWIIQPRINKLAKTNCSKLQN
jgi:hypothetical protein